MAGTSQHRFLMCRPSHFQVTYQANPWMDLSSQPDPTRAMAQWEHLKKTIESCGAGVDVIEQADNLPDMVFSANCGLVRENMVYIANFHYKERQPEREHYEKWFNENGFQVFGDREYFFEGTGDALFAGHTLFAGYGYRSDPAVYQEVLAAVSSPKSAKKDAKTNDSNEMDIELVSLKLTDPRFYHLDTCFCPLTPDLALWYPPAFDPSDRQKLEKAIKLIAVNEADALSFACNCFPIGQHVIIPPGIRSHS